MAEMIGELVSSGLLIITAILSIYFIVNAVESISKRTEASVKLFLVNMFGSITMLSFSVLLLLIIFDVYTF